MTKLYTPTIKFLTSLKKFISTKPRASVYVMMEHILFDMTYVPVELFYVITILKAISKRVGQTDSIFTCEVDIVNEC